MHANVYMRLIAFYLQPQIIKKIIKLDLIFFPGPTIFVQLH